MSLMTGANYSTKNRKEYAVQMITEQPYFSIMAFRIIKMRAILIIVKAKDVNF